LLGEDAAMTSSPSKRRTSSGKQSSVDKAHVISVGRKDALPRKGNVSAGRSKPAVRPPVDAPKEPLATAPARSRKKAPKPQQTETSASRTKAARTAGRASGKLTKPGALVTPAVQPEMVTVLEAVAETAGAVEAPTRADEGSATAAPQAPEGEALAIVETEVEVEASAIMEETTIVEAAFAPAPHHGKRALVTAVSRLLSTLCRWAGVRQ
jgi:hypothetical protein